MSILKLIKCITRLTLVGHSVKKTRLVGYSVGTTRLVGYSVDFHNLKLKGIDIQPPFKTNIGSPQGDALSGTLFNLYFEDNLRNVRAEVPKISPIEHDHSYNVHTKSNIPEELIYADDADFVTKDAEQKERKYSYDWTF